MNRLEDEVESIIPKVLGDFLLIEIKLTNYEGEEQMKLSNLLIFNTVVALPFGIGFLLAPGLMASLYQVETSPSANLVGQFFGVSLIAIGLVTWFSRYVSDADAERALTLGLMIADVLGLIVSLMGTLSGVLNALGWLSVAIYLILSAGYAYFYFSKLRRA